MCVLSMQNFSSSLGVAFDLLRFIHIFNCSHTMWKGTTHVYRNVLVEMCSSFRRSSMKYEFVVTKFELKDEKYELSILN